MSYSIYLKDPVTKETLELPPHDMQGCNILIDENYNRIPTTEASLGITHNYARYYYDATNNDERFYGQNYNNEYVNLGSRGIYGKSGAESIPMLRDMITRIKNKYCEDGAWVTSERTKDKYFDSKGIERDFIWLLTHKKLDYTKEEHTYTISEGDTSDYWEPTAANALKPLYQLLAMAQLRPDGIWDGD